MDETQSKTLRHLEEIYKNAKRLMAEHDDETADTESYYKFTLESWLLLREAVHHYTMHNIYQTYTKVNGTPPLEAHIGKIDTITIPPSQIVEVFGEPSNKVKPNEILPKSSWRWYFEGYHRNVFAIIDWKQTSAAPDIDPDENPPTPDEFWASTEPQELIILADTRLPYKHKFTEWVMQQLDQ